MLMNQIFLAKTFFHDKKEYVKIKFLNIMFFKENEKKNFFRKSGLLAKPKYPENLETSETFFPDSFIN